jgi:cation/acetate symporter
MVTWAFALAGSALTPALLLGIWWPRTTARGALAGMLVGGAVAIGALVGGLVTAVAEPTAGAVLLSPDAARRPGVARRDRRGLARRPRCPA